MHEDRSNLVQRSTEHRTNSIQPLLGDIVEYFADCEGGMLEEEKSKGIRSNGGGAYEHQPAMVEEGDELPTPDVRKWPLKEGASNKR